MIQDIAPHQYDVAYRNTEATVDSIMLVYRKDRLLCHMEGSQVTYPTAKELMGVVPDLCRKADFLFRIDGKTYFELREPEIKAFGAWKYLPKGELRYARPIWKAYAGITGFQIHKWYMENKFCGQCGAKLVHHDSERAMQCPACGKLSYPQICPGVIVGITDGSRILMTKYAKAHSNFKKYALVAGYAEVGESLEDTVRREVMEEVGLKIKNIRYYKSQPWSFTDALLVGFFCQVDGDAAITMDEDELSAAGWFEKDHLPVERSESSISLTGEMIEAFRDGKAG